MYVWIIYSSTETIKNMQYKIILKAQNLQQKTKIIQIEPKIKCNT